MCVIDFRQLNKMDSGHFPKVGNCKIIGNLKAYAVQSAFWVVQFLFEDYVALK